MLHSTTLIRRVAGALVAGTVVLSSLIGTSPARASHRESKAPSATAAVAFDRGQCTWYVNTRRPDIYATAVARGLPPGGWDAWTWADRAQQAGFIVDATPEAGAVAVWPRNTHGAYGAGHVAYVEQVYQDRSFKVSEYNWTHKLGYDTRDHLPPFPQQRFIHGIRPPPPTPPGAPANVAATAGNAQATVRWTAPSSNGGSPITGYVVTSSPGGLTVTAAAPATSATVNGLTNGVAYTFKVAAKNAIGTGQPAQSNPVTPRGSAPTVPGAPTNVVATRGNGQATVSWLAPGSNGGSAITGYIVTSSPGGLTVSAAAPATSATVNGLTNNTSYTFTVAAKNAVGTGQPATSNPVTPRGAQPPGPPTNVVATAGSAQATVRWTVPSSDGGSPITGYIVTSSPGGLTASAAAPATSATVNGLTNNTSYTFTVAAKTAIGTGPQSAASNPVTPQPVSRFALTVSKSGSGSGTVTSSIGGINCGATCAANFDAGTTVTLTATASGNSTFAGWSGACSGTGSCVLVIDASKTATATFYVRGTVSVPAGQTLLVRSGPGTSYSVIGSLPNGAVVSIVCQTRGSSVTGMWGVTNLWDRLSTGGYVSDGFVYTGSNGQVAPSC